MEGKNILYGNVEDLKQIRGIVEARGKCAMRLFF